MKQLCVFFSLLLSSVALAAPAKQDFSLYFFGDIATTKENSNRWDPSYFNGRYRQLFQTQDFKCELNLKSVHFKKRLKNVETSDSYTVPDNSTCIWKIGSSRLNFGYMSPEWSHSLGLGSGDLFAAYDFRDSMFADSYHRLYNPGVLYEYFFDELTVSLYAGQAQFFSKDDVPTGMSWTEVKETTTDLGLGFFKSMPSIDVNLYFVQLMDRSPQYNVNMNLGRFDKIFKSYSAASLGVSSTAWGGTILRADITKYFDKTMTTENYQAVQVAPLQGVIGLETPTLWRTIFSLQYSSQKSFSDETKKIYKFNGAEWILFSARTTLSDSQLFELYWLYNHLDGTQLVKSQFTWPNKRLSELSVGVESYMPTNESPLKASFDDYMRIYFRYNVNVTL